MVPSIVRCIVFPAHESLLGRPTLSILRSLAQDAPGSEAGVSAYQQERAAALFEHAREHVPYWQQRRGETGSHRVLTRSDIRTQLESMRWTGAPGKLIRHTSSGTTDDNLNFYQDRQRQAWARALRLRALARLGIEPGEKQLHFWPHFASGGTLSVAKDVARFVRDRLTNDVVFDLRPMTASRMDEALALLERYRPALVIGYPSWLFALAQHRLRSHRRRGRAAPHFVLTTGELLYEFQRQSIESAFGARVVEEYGSQEVGLIASQDVEGQWRVNWEHVALEVLRDGRAAQPGELGEIVATNLHSFVMPFIRYATGDIVAAPAAATVPDRPSLTTLPRLEGRASDMLVDADGRPRPNRDLVETLARETKATEFSLHQTAPDRILCSTIREGGWIGQQGRVTELLRSALGETVQVDWEVGSAFEPLRSGKRRYVSSPVALALLAHDRVSDASLARAWPQRVFHER
jgi:phenylacetate-CoA ligase